MKPISKFHQDMSYKSRLGLTTALSTALAAMAISPATMAQDEAADSGELEEIIVTGIRGALKTARDNKRGADTAMDSITASDVSALPDLSVAEALARVPGVVVTRIGLGGSGDGDFPSPEGSGNLIRGLQLVRSEFNGRDAFSANGGRSLDFGTVPPELIGGVDVYKNSSADLIQGGIGGTINLRTLEPFDREGHIAVVSLDATYTDLRDKWAPDASVVLGNRWETSGGEFGLLGSISHSELKSDLNGFQIGQLYPIATDGVNVAIPGGVQLRTNEVDRERKSYYGAAQWRNEDENLEIVVKYARIENETVGNERTLEWFGDGESWAGTSLVGDYTTTPFSSAGLAHCNGSNDPDPANASCENTTPVSALYESGIISNNLRDWTGSDGAQFSTLGINKQEQSMTDDLSINIEWQPTDRLFINLDAHKTNARYDRTELWGGTWFFSDFRVNADLDDPMLQLEPTSNNNPFRTGCAWGGCATPLSAETNDPANSFLIFSSDGFEDNEGDMYALKGDVEYEFDNDGWFQSVKFGARYSERDQINRSAGMNWASLAPPWTGGYYLPMGELATPGHEVVDFSDFYRGGVVTGDHTEVIFVDREMLSNYDAWRDAMLSDPNVNGDWNPLKQNGAIDWTRGTIGDIVEKTSDFYVRLDYGNDFDNGMSLEGNFGVRYTKSTVSGNGQFDYAEITGANEAIFIPETVAYFAQGSEDRSGKFNSLDYWLPSFNAKLNLNEESLVRFAVSKALTRPNIAQLRSSQSANVSSRYDVDNTTTPPTFNAIIPTQINVYGGNPDLQAIESWNYDLSFEHYWGQQNSATAAFFLKDITNNIIYESVTLDTVTLDGYEVPIVFNGDLNQDTAKIKGFELAYQQFFDQYEGILGNLGIQANYTYIDAKTNAPVAVVDADGDGAPDNFDRIYRYGIPSYLGLSEHTYNLVGIYQDEKLEVRLAYNWRSEHLSTYRDWITGNPVFQKPVGYLDGSVKYSINEMTQVRVQLANILNTKAQAEQQIDEAGQRFGRTSFMQDRRIKVGVRFNF